MNPKDHNESFIQNEIKNSKHTLNNSAIDHKIDQEQEPNSNRETKIINKVKIKSKNSLNIAIKGKNESFIKNI